MSNLPFRVEDSDHVKQVISAYLKDAASAYVGAPVKLSTNLTNGGLIEVIQTTANSDEVIGVVDYDFGWTPNGQHPHQGNNSLHLNPENRIIPIRRLFGIGMVRCLANIAAGTQVVAGEGGVSAKPSLGSTTPITVLGRLLTAGTTGNLAQIYFEKSWTLV